MAVLPACLHHCPSFAPASLSSISAKIGEMNTWRLCSRWAFCGSNFSNGLKRHASRHKLHRICNPSWRHLHPQCLTPLIIYVPCLQIHQKMSSTGSHLNMESPSCCCKTSDCNTAMKWLHLATPVGYYYDWGDWRRTDSKFARTRTRIRTSLITWWKFAECYG